MMTGAIFRNFFTVIPKFCVNLHQKHNSDAYACKVCRKKLPRIQQQD